MSNNLNTIKNHFTKYGEKFTKVKEGVNAFLFVRTDENGRALTYEVFKKRPYKAHPKDPNPAGYLWAYPNTEAFGAWAWNPRSRERAIEIFNNLENGS